MLDDSQITDLPSIGVLASLDTDERAHLARFGKAVEVDSREIVIRQGESRDSFFIVLKGKIRVYRRSNAGFETTLAELGPGETLGDMNFLDRQPAIATGQAFGGAHLWRISRGEFERFAANHPTPAFKLTREMAVTVVRRLRRAVRKMTDEGQAVGEGWW